MADSIEHGILEGAGDDTARCMSRYFFVHKLAAAFGVGAALPIAEFLYFNPQAIDANTGFEGSKFVAFVLPSLVAAPAVFLPYNYPIDEKRHAEIRRELQARGMETT